MNPNTEAGAGPGAEAIPIHQADISAGLEATLNGDPHDGLVSIRDLTHEQFNEMYSDSVFQSYPEADVDLGSLADTVKAAPAEGGGLADGVVPAAEVAPQAAGEHVDPTPAEAPPDAATTRLAEINDKIASGKATAKDRTEHRDLLAARKAEKELPDAVKAVQEGTATPRQEMLYKQFQQEQLTKERDELKAKEAAGEELSEDEKTRLQELDGEIEGEEKQELTPEAELEKALSEFDPKNAESYGPFLDKIQELSTKLSGVAENQQMREAFAQVVRGYFDRHKDMNGLSKAERKAFKEVQEDIVSMQRDVLDVLNAKKMIKLMKEARAKQIEEIKKLESSVPPQVGEDDKNGQEAAFKLTQAYNQLAVLNARTILTARQAEFANEDFRFKRAKIRRTLGITGFWRGLGEQSIAYVKNQARAARRETSTFIKEKSGARPLAMGV